MKTNGRKEWVKDTFWRLLQNKQFYIFLGLLGVLVFTYSTVNLDMLSDDGEYLRMMDTYPNYFEFISFTYQSLNGRIVANSASFLFLQLDSLVPWALISIFAIASIAYNIGRLFGKRPTWGFINVALGLIFCLSFRVLSSSMLWFTGAIFYLWPIAILLYLLADLSDCFYYEKSVHFGWRYVLNLFLGLTLTLWSEQVALVLIGFYGVCFVCRTFIRRQKFNCLELIPLVIWLIGFCAMFFAPSQRVRMNNVYGYAAFEGGLKYLLENGVYWTFRAIFVEQRILMLLLGAITLLCADRKKRPWLIRTFEFVFSISIVLLLIHGTSFSAYVDASKYIYDIPYLADTGYTFASLLPYCYWTVYCALTVSIILINSEKKFATALTMLAALATLVIMWFSTTMYASGYRTCALFCVAIVALTVKMLREKDKEFMPFILGAGLVNILLFSDFLSQHFIIFY